MIFYFLPELDHLRKVMSLAFGEAKKGPVVAAAAAASASTSNGKDAMPPSDADRIAYMMSVCAKFSVESTSILDTIGSFLQFLLMNINRSQDFVKASSNLALTPSYETVDIVDVLRFVETCMSHTSNGRIITIHPLPEDMCPMQITDRHYLTDNLLCLISNATKYSDTGTIIDVRLKFVTSPARTKAAVTATASGSSDAKDNHPRGVEISVADTGT